MISASKYHRLRQWLKSDNYWFAVWARNALRTWRQVNLSWIGYIVVPLWYVQVVIREVWRNLARIIWYTPIFQSRLKQPADGLILWNGMPEIAGAVDVTLGKGVKFAGAVAIIGRPAARDLPQLTIGDNTYIGPRTVIAVGNRIHFGKNVLVAGPAYFPGFPSHPYDAQARARGEPETQDQVGDIVIGDDVWLATNVTVLKGVTIGAGTVVGTASVVTRDLPPNVLAAGSPARVIRQLHPKDPKDPKSAAASTTQGDIALALINDCFTTIPGQPPCVSVVVPCYNVAPYVGEALQSVFAQTFQNFEVIVVNDGSPDYEALLNVLAPFMSRIVYVERENGGLSAARNSALAVAKGEFIALLDGDDIWEPRYLELQVAELRRNPWASVSYTNALYFGQSALDGRRYMEVFDSQGPVTIETVLRGQINIFGGLMAKREPMVAVGGFDESLPSAEDLDMWLRLLAAGHQFTYTREPLYRYRQRSGSLTSNTLQLSTAVLTVVQKLMDTHKLTEAEIAACREKILSTKAEMALHAGKLALSAGDYEKATRDLSAAQTYYKRPKIGLTLALLWYAPRPVVAAISSRLAGLPKSNATNP